VDIYIDVNNLRGQGAIPMRTTQDIIVDLRSTNLVLTRIGAEVKNAGRVSRIKGMTSSF
jgi:hypothetical protein